MKGIDHFMYAGSDMDRLAAHFGELTGIATQPGGSHPDLGTRNHLVGTDTATYLELIAPDPALPAQSPMRSAFEAMARPQIHRFIALARSDDFPTLQRAYAQAGIDAPARELQRVTATGETLRWKLMVPADPNPLGVFAPLFIDWLDTPHPAARLQPACRILSCEAGHPDADRVQALWRALGVELPLLRADRPYLRVSLETPRGTVALTSAC